MLHVAVEDSKRAQEIGESEVHHDLERHEQWDPEQPLGMARTEDREDREQHEEAQKKVGERRQDARRRQELQRHAHLLHERRVRQDGRGAGLE